MIVIESTGFGDSNDKNLKDVWHIANVTKPTLKYHHKMLANQVDNKHAFNSACVVRSSVTDGTFIDRDAALGDFRETTRYRTHQPDCHGQENRE